jgi:DNA-directed RNA polymerase subunit RPC12/RpoP
MASFRQECPSCGDLVLLDSKLAGKKTDCPKCKFRFIVSDPRAKDEEEDIDDEEGDDDEEPPIVLGPKHFYLEFLFFNPRNRIIALAANMRLPHFAY